MKDSIPILWLISYQIPLYFSENSLKFSVKPWIKRIFLFFNSYTYHLRYFELPGCHLWWIRWSFYFFWLRGFLKVRKLSIKLN